MDRLVRMLYTPYMVKTANWLKWLTLVHGKLTHWQTVAHKLVGMDTAVEQNACLSFLGLLDKQSIPINQTNMINTTDYCSAELSLATVACCTKYFNGHRKNIISWQNSPILLQLNNEGTDLPSRKYLFRVSLKLLELLTNTFL